MTAVIETAAPVVMVTADGEARSAKTWGQDSYSCTFCDSPVYGPLDWEQHERDNAECYAKTGEAYTGQPYTQGRHWEARECANPGCISWLNADAIARVREDQRREQERKDRDAAEKAREQAKRDAAEQRKTRAAEIHAAVGEMGRQLGFAWCCTHTEPAQAHGADPEMCEASGWDRGEYDAHVRGHGAKSITGVKPIKLPRRAPKAKLPKLDVNPFKFITWTQSITVHDEMGRPDHTETAERRGQFWAVGPNAHSVWVLPYEPSPWEAAVGIARAKPELVYCGQPGRFFQDSYSAKYDRR